MQDQTSDYQVIDLAPFLARQRELSREFYDQLEGQAIDLTLQKLSGRRVA